MATNALSPDALGKASLSASQFGRKPSRMTMILFFTILIAGLLFTGYSLKQDVDDMGTVVTTWTPFVLLGVALLIALGFEFVNGFHDTANAVATVIYTHSLPPGFAVVWSGFFNFLGVMLSSGAVAFGIIALLPVELILQTGSSAGFAMIFALLIAAIIWNLGAWWLGLPASSSHTLIGSIIGVGIANALMHGRDGTSGVDWSQATKIGYSLLLSPLVGFGCAALLLLAMRMFIKNRALYKAPEGNAPPPLWIRAMLIVTCTGVSFAHGSNDGQKGMGLIMLILVGTLPMAYALNRTMPADQATQFGAIAEVTQQALMRSVPLPAPTDSRKTLSDYLVSKQAGPDLIPALAVMTGKIGNQVASYGSLSKVPAEAVTNVRNDMYLTSETIRLMEKNKVGDFDADTRTKLEAFKGQIDSATRFIPTWVKIVVAIALGLGTMVGWKRIVVTVGERIGKTHMTYAQGASAEVVAMFTIGAADMYGLPVSTTHVLSSGVAGSMVANGSGLQMRTLRNLATAWVLTLPAAILLSGSLYWVFSKLF
ncbi:inorganic phosphate transporter [Pseudomonas syringae]|uniref:inorganic phosphate transporter n=2 Tax=Pseudomonas syringae TaxID=317 RepID=UPI0006CB438C|nr:inorganic phosphate transporter [Pseudomonas syringae]ALD99638.1 nuclease PIN [Pseudomonas syringae UMAF0158]